MVVVDFVDFVDVDAAGGVDLVVDDAVVAVAVVAAGVDLVVVDGNRATTEEVGRHDGRREMATTAWVPRRRIRSSLNWS
jgi:hypothetical protein